MKIAFLVGDIVHVSGGSNVIVEYAVGLQARGHDVTLIPAEPIRLEEPCWHPKLPSLRIVPLTQVGHEAFDVAFATWWITFFDLWRLNAKVYGYFNQSLESRFHQEEHYKLLNHLTYSAPLFFITEARWIQEFIQQQQPSARVAYVRNGLSREHFPCVKVPVFRNGPLKVLVEGRWGVGFKGVPETFDLIERASRENQLEVGWLTSASDGHRPRVGGKAVTVHEAIPMDRVRYVYQQYDVLVKMSRVEGMFGPPLEMFSQGGTAIARVVTGCEEYMVHGQNSLLVPPYDSSSVVRYLSMLSKSPGYLGFLRTNALVTANEYPGWEPACDEMDMHLRSLERDQYSNAELRGLLASIASLRGRWLERIWRDERAAKQEAPTVTAAYLKLKHSRVGKTASAIFTPRLRGAVRSFASRMVR
jgi:glycosyltransferase involved in cell wall biosynthesis